MSESWYRFDEHLEGWRFRSRETCRGVWEVEGIRQSDGLSVSRNGASDPNLLFEECIADARELDSKSE